LLIIRCLSGVVEADSDELKVARVVSAGNNQELSGEKSQNQDCHAHG